MTSKGYYIKLSAKTVHNQRYTTGNKRYPGYGETKRSLMILNVSMTVNVLK